MCVECDTDRIRRRDHIVIVVREDDALDFLESIRASRDAGYRSRFVACVGDGDVRSFAGVVDDVDIGIANILGARD